MLRPTPQQYQALSRLKRQPDGQVLLALLRTALEDANLGMRTATGERIGWMQGEAQCLAGWIEHFGKADELA